MVESLHPALLADSRCNNLTNLDSQWQPQPLPQECPPFFLPEELSPAPAAANVENFFASFFEPQCGHSEFFQSVERTRISLSRSHWSQ
jgi:hypothetical protein